MKCSLGGASPGTWVGNKSVSAPQVHCNACSQTLTLLKYPTLNLITMSKCFIAGTDEFGKADWEGRIFQQSGKATQLLASASCRGSWDGSWWWHVDGQVENVFPWVCLVGPIALVSRRSLTMTEKPQKLQGRGEGDWKECWWCVVLVVFSGWSCSRECWSWGSEVWQFWQVTDKSTCCRTRTVELLASIAEQSKQPSMSWLSLVPSCHREGCFHISACLSHSLVVRHQDRSLTALCGNTQEVLGNTKYYVSLK